MPPNNLALALISDEHGLLIFMRDIQTKAVVSPVLRVQRHQMQAFRDLIAMATTHQGVFSHVAETTENLVQGT